MDKLDFLTSLKSMQCEFRSKILNFSIGAPMPQLPPKRAGKEAMRLNAAYILRFNPFVNAASGACPTASPVCA
jgi:hypothetical protein